MTDNDLIKCMLVYFPLLIIMVFNMKRDAIRLNKEKMQKKYTHEKELAVVNVRTQPKELDRVINSYKRYKAAGYLDK